MADLGINTKHLNDYVKPALKRSLNFAKEAHKKFQNLKVPEKFEYRMFLSGVPSRMNDMIADVDYLIKKVDSVLEQINEIEGKNYNGINTYAYFSSFLLNPNGDWDIPDFSDNSTVRYYNREINKYQTELDDLNEKIRLLNQKIVANKKMEKRSKGFYDGGEKLEIWQQELNELKSQKQELETKLTELKQLKKITVKTLEEQFYKSLQSNIDFASLCTCPEISQEEIQKIINYLTQTEVEGSGTNVNRVNKVISEENMVDMTSINLFEFARIYGHTLPFQGLYSQKINSYVNSINYMTPEEINTYNYLYNSKGVEVAEKYLSDKQEELNSREGMFKAIQFLDTIDVNDPNVGDYIQTSFKGLGDGTTNFFEGLDNAFGGMDGVISAKQYEVMYIMTGLSEEQLDSIDFLSDDLKNKIKGLQENGALSATYEISSSIGNMLPAMAASTVVSLVATPAAGSLVGSVLMGVSAGGNTAEQAYQQGHGYWESVLYGTLNGTSEAALSYFLGGIPGLSKLDDIPGVKGYLVNVLKEGGEESIQAMLDPYLKNLALGTNETINWEEVMKSGLYGMITAGVLNGGSMIINGTTVTVDSLLQHSDLINKAAEQGVTIDVSRIGDDSYWNQLSIDLTGKGLSNYTNAEVQTEITTSTTTKQETSPKVSQSTNQVNAAISDKVSTVINQTNETNNTAAHITNKVSSNVKVNTTTNSKLPELKIGDLNYSKNSTVKGAAAYLASNVRKYSYTNTNEVSGLNEQIMNDGLYHFTTAADAILSSGYIKASDMISSYGNKKTFFFVGIPEVGAFATNIDSIPLKAESVKVMPNEEIVNSSKLKVRAKDDGAISYDGNFNLEGTIATKEYFCLFKEGDKLVYKNVTKEFYDNYQNTPEGQQLSAFVKKKSNVTAIKNDFLCNMTSKNTGANIENNITTKLEVLKNNIITSKNFSKNQLNAIKKYDNFNDFNDAYMHGKTGLNTQEWYEVMGYYKINQSMNISENIATELENIFDQDNYVIGIHKTGVDGALIANNGLHLTGYKFVNSSDIDLKLNIEFTNGYSDFLMQMAAAANYKSGDSGNAIIVKIPKSKFNNVETLVDFDNALPILKPEYIAGYVNVSKGADGKIQFNDITVNNIGNNDSVNLESTINNENTSENLTDNINTLLKKAADYKNNGYTGIGTSGYGIAESAIDQVVLNGLTKSESAIFGYICKEFEGRIDFTNTADVLEKREARLAYINRDAELYVQLKNMKKQGATLEELTSFANKTRNEAKDATRKEGNFLLRCQLGCRNIAKFGNLDIVDNGKYKSDLIEKIDYKGRTTYEIKPEIIDGWLQECGINDATAQSEEIYNKFLQKIGYHFGIKEKVSELALGPDLEGLKQKCVQEFKREGIVNPSDEQIYNKIINKALSPNPALNIALGISPDLSFSWP